MSANKKRRATRRAYWLDQIRAQVESGLSVTKWCEQSGVSKDGLYRWRSRLRRDGTLGGAAARDSAVSAFANVEVVEAAGLPRGLRVDVGGRSIVIDGDFDEAVLSRLVQLLERLS